jgi:hypothetical protein
MITAIDKPNRDGTDRSACFGRLRPGACREVALHQIARIRLAVRRPERISNPRRSRPHSLRR